MSGLTAESSGKIARKHIQISLAIKDVVSACAPRAANWAVYVATYTAGRSGTLYQEIEAESGATFWSLILRSCADNRKLKHPDVIVTVGSNVRYLFEVKWGAIKGLQTSDVNENCLRDIEDASGGTNQARRLGGFCRVRGPAAEGGLRYRSAQFRQQMDFAVDNASTFLLLSDFVALKSLLPSWYSTVVPRLLALQAVCTPADINVHTDGIPSLCEVLRRDGSRRSLAEQALDRSS
jgi:hypothetical protein